MPQDIEKTPLKCAICEKVCNNYKKLDEWIFFKEFDKAICDECCSRIFKILFDKNDEYWMNDFEVK